MREVRFGLIGCGLMGREFASATVRWCHLLDLQFKPTLVGICDTNPEMFKWYEQFSTIRIKTQNYKELLASKDIEAVYCAVPHNLHKEIYIEILKAGKHLMGEKPFGIDLAANEAIMAEIAKYPDLFVRCSSEFPFFPGAQRVIQAIRERKFGRIIEVNSGFLHSSDLDPNKPINWKRMVDINGEYGCLGDLGMHALHLPLRMGWMPKRLYAHLGKIVSERPDGKGGMAPCKTWDNGSLYCDVVDPSDRNQFPMTVKIYRIAPSETDTWYIEILGTQYSIRYSTKYPKTLQYMEYKSGGAQTWQHEDLGYKSVYPAITGGIFEFGFSDAILQMWASYLDEMQNRGKNLAFGCVKPEETLQSHKIFTAALESEKTRQAIAIE